MPLTEPCIQPTRITIFSCVWGGGLRLTTSSYRGLGVLDPGELRPQSLRTGRAGVGGIIRILLRGLGGRGEEEGVLVLLNQGLADELRGL